MKWDFEMDYSNSHSSNKRGKPPGRKPRFVFLHIQFPPSESPVVLNVFTTLLQCRDFYHTGLMKRCHFLNSHSMLPAIGPVKF